MTPSSEGVLTKYRVLLQRCWTMLRSKRTPTKNQTMESVTNIIKISSNPQLNMSPEGDFFRVWVEFLKPIHNLTNKEMDVLAAFLKKRYELGKVITDPDVLDTVLMGENTKKQIREDCKITSKHFQVIMCKFRKKGVVMNNRIFLNLIPTITQEGVGLMVYFNFKNEQHIEVGYGSGF